MLIEGRETQRPPEREQLVTLELLVDRTQHATKHCGIHAGKHPCDGVRAGFPRADQGLQATGNPKHAGDGIEAAGPRNSHEKAAEPDGRGRNPRALTRIHQSGHVAAEVEDLLEVRA
ncbi:MAG TPA: hypothetical protein PLQ73_05810, partial [Planctomycetota bacterium]|nr:hypothetical protein [Planctomycetota bacterium]HQC01852.1 hypothetical protein [Planctomycetota bacterium]